MGHNEKVTNMNTEKIQMTTLNDLDRANELNDFFLRFNSNTSNNNTLNLYTFEIDLQPSSKYLW